MAEQPTKVIGRFVEKEKEMAEQELIVQLDQHPIIYRGQRCVTYEWIDQVHGREDGTAKRAYSDNQERFKEGRDYFDVPYDEDVEGLNGGTKNVPPKRGGHRGPRKLFTEKGYCLLAKSLTDDRAWEVQVELIDGYFRKRVEEFHTPAERLLAMSERTTQAIRLLVEQERELRGVKVEQLALRARQDQVEAKVEETRGEVQGLIEVQREAMREATQLALSPNQAAPKTPRAAITEILASYALRKAMPLKGPDFRSAYSRLYREFRLRYHIDLQTLTRNSGAESCLEQAENMGYDRRCGDLVINALWALATELFGPVVLN